MIKKIFLFSFCLLSTILFAQESMLIHSKSYPATPKWDFICESYALSGQTNVQIAKTEKGGLLKLTIETTDTKFVIAGTVYVDLADLSVITCTEKNMREVDGNNIIAYYTFSAAEMNRLKQNEIRSIRYTIKGKDEKFSSQTGRFTAINKKSYFATVYNTSKKSYDTAEAVQLLLSN